MAFQLNFLVTIYASLLIPLKETLNSPLSPSATSIAPDLSLILKLLVTCMPSMVKVFISISLVSRFIPVLVAAKAPERPRQSSSGPVGAPSRDRIPA
jgi:hypothetical protein